MQSTNAQMSGENNNNKKRVICIFSLSMIVACSNNLIDLLLDACVKMVLVNR